MSIFSQIDGTAAHGLLFVGLLLFVMRLRPAWSARTDGPKTIAVYCLLIAAILAACAHIWPHLENLFGIGTIYALSLSVSIYVLGRASTAYLVLPISILFLAAPIVSSLSFHLVYPLRLISTQIAGIILELGGLSVIRNGTEILVGNHHFVVTEACSGITLFDTMVWIALLWVSTRQEQGWVKLAQYLIFVPIVILGNALRVSILVIGADRIGEAVLTGPLHFYLGWITVIASVVSFVILSRCLSLHPEPEAAA